MIDIFRRSLNRSDKSLRWMMDPYQNFEDIPVERRSNDHLMAWLRSLHGELGKIPLPLVSDDMRAVSIRVNGLLSPIRFSDTPNYLELALSAVREWPGLILQVDQEAITEDFVLKAVEPKEKGPMVLKNILDHWEDRFLPAITQRVMDSALSRSLNAALSAATYVPHRNNVLPDSIRNMVTDTQLSLALIDNTSELAFLNGMGKLPLLTQAFENGYWPGKNDVIFFSSGPINFRFQKPTLEEAIEERTRPDNAHAMGASFDSIVLRLFFSAFIKTFPITEVLAHCVTPAHVQMLDKMYEREQITPHLRHYPLLKALLLEDALGL